MPVGRFRDDPRELGERERAIHARQYPEGLLVVGTLLGTVVRMGFELDVLQVATLVYALGQVGLHVDLLTVSPEATAHSLSILGVLVGGVGGYLLGIRYRARKIRAIEQSGSRSDDAVRDTDAQAVAAESEVPGEGGGGE